LARCDRRGDDGRNATSKIVLVAGSDSVGFGLPDEGLEIAGA
jgi:hypothetical protein